MYSLKIFNQQLKFMINCFYDTLIYQYTYIVFYVRYKLKYQLNIYVLLLREVGKAIRKNERAYGLAIIRYLRLVWLNQFKDIINYEMNNFNKTPQPF